MKVIIIGAGASGIAAAINTKRKYPKDEVIVIEHSDRPLRKILATGNGRCNLGNAKLDISLYNHPEFMKDFSYNDYVVYVESFGFKTKLLGDLLYPYSESAQTVRNQMIKTAEKLGVCFCLNEDFVDYQVFDNVVKVKTSLKKYEADKLIIATGAKSTSGLGNNGSIFEILKHHNYQIEPLHPGLVPIKTKENTKALDGVRTKAAVILFKNGQKIFKESGEVLFKKDGLSGIVIMNASNHIKNDKNKYEISLDILPDFIEESHKNNQQFLDNIEFLNEYLSPKFVEYFSKDLTDKNIIKKLKDWRFHFKDFYDYENSQITIGGVDLSQVTNNLESKHEKNVYFLGEVLDMSGPCGGYNLTWAFMSAKKLLS